MEQEEEELIKMITADIIKDAKEYLSDILASYKDAHKIWPIIEQSLRTGFIQGVKVGKNLKKYLFKYQMLKKHGSSNNKGQDTASGADA